MLFFIVRGLTLTNGMDASNVFGQLDFVSSSGGTTASNLGSPNGISLDIAANAASFALNGGTEIAVAFISCSLNASFTELYTGIP